MDRISVRIGGAMALMLMAGACSATATRATREAAESRTAAGAGVSPRRTSTFTIHGVDADDIRMLSLEGTPDAMGAGDVVDIDGLLVMVPEPGAYELRATVDDDGRVVLLGPGGEARTVGAVVPAPDQDDELAGASPRAAMSADEIRGLWGVRVEDWSEDIQALLQHIDPMRTCVVLTTGVAKQTGNAVPALPEGLRCLAIHSGEQDEFHDYSTLATQTELRYFELDLLGTTRAFDARLLTGSPHIRHLRIEDDEIVTIQALAALAELRVLVVHDSELTDISFVSALRDLKHLDIAMTGVTDLTPIGGLARLETLVAQSVPATRLPRRALPGLRSADLMISGLSDEEVAAFAGHNPDCRIRHRWRPMLMDALRGVTRVRVRDARDCVEANQDTEFLFEVSDPQSVAEAIASLDFEEPEDAIVCGCCGDVFLDFYRDDALAASLSFHHAMLLRWSEWPGSAFMTQASAEILANWLAEHGVSGPRDELIQERAKSERYQRKLARSLAYLPEPLRDGFFEKDFAERFAAAVPAPEDRVAALLSMYGVGNGDWRNGDAIETAVNKLLDAYPAEVLRAQVRAALLGTSRHRRRGAARYWPLGPETPLEDWRPDDAGKLIEAVLTVQQEARDTAVRWTALSTLLRWHGSLPARVLDRHLDRALRDPDPWIREGAMGMVRTLGHERSIPHLLALVRGKTPAVIALAEVPPDELDGASTEPLWDGEQPAGWDPAAAALTLGLFGHTPAKKAIKAAMEAATRAGRPRLEYDLALALLGDHDRLAPAHFKAKKKEIVAAAVEVVVRTRGVHGLGMAVQSIPNDHGTRKPFVRIRSMLLASLDGKPPGRAIIEVATSLRDLAAWYSEFGQQYIEQVKAR